MLAPSTYADVIQEANDAALKRDEALFNSLNNKPKRVSQPLPEATSLQPTEIVAQPPVEEAAQAHVEEIAHKPQMPETVPPNGSPTQGMPASSVDPSTNPSNRLPGPVQGEGSEPVLEPSPSPGSQTLTSPIISLPSSTTTPSSDPAQNLHPMPLAEVPNNNDRPPSSSVVNPTQATHPLAPTLNGSSFETTDSNFYIFNETAGSSLDRARLQSNDSDWIEKLKLKQSKRRDFEISHLGPAGVGLLSVKPHRATYMSITAGAGPNGAKIVSAEVGLSPSAVGASFSLLVEKAQWLDPYTNTGKLASSAYGLLCVGGVAFGTTVALTPCLGGGLSSGIFKDRDFQNDIQTHVVTAKGVKTVSFKGMILYNLFGSHAIDWTVGYSEDVFLWGGFAKILTSTPIPTVYIGAQTHGPQRSAMIVSSAVSW